MHRLALAFAPPREPIAHGLGQALGIDAEAGFEKAVGDRESVIKLGLTRKVAHTKIVEPIDGTRTRGAGARLRARHNFDAEFSSVHAASIVHRLDLGGVLAKPAIL